MTDNQMPPYVEDVTGETTPKDPFAQFIDHQRKALEESGKALDALIPEGFREHSSEARKEFIKGMKVLVDAAVAELEKASREMDKNFRRATARQDVPPTETPERPSTTGPNKVKVRVE